MNNATKLLSSLTLLAAGFGGAWLVGPPELTEGLVHRLLPTQPADANGLRPLGPDSFAPPYVPSAGSGSAANAAAPAPFSPGPTAPLPATFATTAVPGAFAPSSSPSPAAVARGADAEWFDAWPTLPDAPPSATSAAPVATDRAAAPSWWNQPAEAEATPPAAAELAQATHEPAWLEPRAGDAVVATNEVAPPQALGPRFGPSTPQAGVQPAAGWFDARQRVAGFAPQATAEQTADIAPVPPAVEPGLDGPIDRAPSREPRWGSHVVSDGDTLERLAERYLGAPSRAGELFELNRDRLASPDLLPIGLVLKTPPRDSVREQTAAEPAPFSMISAPLPSAGDSGGSLAAERPLVPVGSPTEGDPWQAAEEAWPADQPAMARDLSW